MPSLGSLRRAFSKLLILSDTIMANPLPIIIAAGAAILLLGGKKKSTTKKVLLPPDVKVAGWLTTLGYDPSKPDVISSFKNDWNLVRSYINAWQISTPPELPVSNEVTQNTATVMLFIQQELIPKRYAGSWIDLRDQATAYYAGESEAVHKHIPRPVNCGERFKYLLTSADGSRSFQEPCLDFGVCLGDDREAAMDRAREVNYLVRKAWNILINIENNQRLWTVTEAETPNYNDWQKAFDKLPDHLITVKALLPEVQKTWQIVMVGACLLDVFVTAIEAYGHKWEG